MAEVEGEHLAKLYQQTISLLGASALPPLAKFKEELKVEQMEGGIEVTSALSTAYKINSEADALEIAMEKEYLAYDYYKRSAALVAKPEVKDLLHELAADEKNHASLLLSRFIEIIR